MWRSILLHEFRGTDIRTLQGLPGHVTPRSRSLTPADGVVTIAPGQGFRYVLDTPLAEVIGVSLRVRFRYPSQHTVGSAQLISLEPSFELFVDGQTHERLRLRARIGTVTAELAAPPITHPRFMDLRLDWHTSGQAFLRADGQLIAYRNAFRPGDRFGVAHVAFGLLDTPPSLSTPTYDIARVFVRALARSDSLAAISRDLPPTEFPSSELNTRCRQRILANAMNQLDQLRALMGQVHQSLSQPWSAGIPGDDPFTPASIRAHQLAFTCITSLRRMLRAQDFSDPQSFVDAFTEFLEILRAARPADFSGLVATLTEPPKLPPECQQLIDAARDQAALEFEPLLAFFRDLTEVIHQVAEGD